MSGPTPASPGTGDADAPDRQPLPARDSRPSRERVVQDLAIYTGAWLLTATALFLLAWWRSG